MTPERTKWWDCLPTEEKRVRLAIVWQEIELYDYKFLLNEKGGRLLNTRLAIKRIKSTIKALRMQLAMRPIWTATLLGNFYKCPRCTKNVWGNYQHCPECGQKLRWDCGQKLKLRCQQ